MISPAFATPLRIGLDVRCLNRAHVRGMGRYVSSLLTGVDRAADVGIELLADRPDLPVNVPPLRRANLHVFDQRGDRVHAWEQFALPRMARRLRPDVIHCTATGLPLWQPVPTVVTVHDTVPWSGMRQSSARRWYYDWLLPRAYRKAAAIITISQSSRRDILSLWPELEPRIAVIPHGVDDSYLSEQEPRPERVAACGVRRPYLLYVGGDIARKRLDWSLRVLERLRHAEAMLVVCGVGEESRDAILARVPDGLRHRVAILGFVSDDDLRELYRFAAAVLYPTRYEGFGLPVVEAHAVGTPILFSAVGSLAELHGPASVLLPADDLDAWVAACEDLLEQRGADPAPRPQAREWASGFSWKTSAEQHLAVYRRAADGHAAT